jgi:hypothetical protein
MHAYNVYKLNFTDNAKPPTKIIMENENPSPGPKKLCSEI